jgi:hypothetical protein
MLCACTIIRNVKPIPATDISLICIKHNPVVQMEEFRAEVVKQIEAKGIHTQLYVNELPAECGYTLEYMANWKWDWAVYLRSADLKVKEGDNLIGRVTYDASGAGGTPAKFGTTAEKIRPLIDEMFAQVTQKSK